MLGTDYPNFTFMSPGIIIHEQLHTFGMPDFYRYTSATRPPGPVGEPVGLWDIMSTISTCGRLPFANTHAFRRYLGWGAPPVQISDSGTFTLHPLGAQVTPGQTTAFVIPVENRPNEFILLEYRSHMNPTAYDTFLETSANYRAGLTITRINTGFNGNARSGDPGHQGGDASFRDEVYIFRPGTTVRNAGVNAANVSNTAIASLSANSGRTSFGNAQGTGYNGIIYTQEGYNTGIEIYNVSMAGSTITFSVYLGEGDPITSLSPEMALRAAVLGAGSTPTVIYLTQDIVLSEVQAPLTILPGRHVILRSAGDATFTISTSFGDSFDPSLTAYNFCTIRVGTQVLADANAYLVLDGVNVTREPGTIGNGIDVRMNGHLTLLDGTISGHNSGAVINRNIFIMEGGEIANNTATANNFGGAVTNAGGTFTLRGGIIANNYSTSASSGTVRNAAASIASVLTPGVFTMEGGIITNNTTSGGNGGGGVCNTSIFNMSGGVISGNSAPRGGGVSNMNTGGVFTMTGGEISGNTATALSPNGGGGGVLSFSNGTFNMGAGEIHNNTSYHVGGGVMVGNPGSTFTMTGGVIRNNTVMGNAAARVGGGVSVFAGASVNMQAGEITGNSAYHGGGIGITRAFLQAGSLTVGANAVFAGNVSHSNVPREPFDAVSLAIYASNIHATQWTIPFTHGFNNFDIEYSTLAHWMPIRPLDFVLGGTAANPTVPQGINTLMVHMNTSIMQAPGFPTEPTRLGYVFAGWYLDAGFTQVLTDAALMPDNITSTRLYARWALAATYNITVNVQGSGTAVASVASAPAGTTITLMAMPGAGYGFAEWQVVGGGILLSSTTDASATFTMPDTDVVVLAVFEVLPVVTSVFVMPNNAGPIWWLVHVSPGGGWSHGFNAQVGGTNNPPQTVIWTVEGGTSSETFMSDAGVLYVGIDETARDLFVRAASTHNPNVSGFLVVRVLGSEFHELTFIPDATNICCCLVQPISMGHFPEGYRFTLWPHLMPWPGEWPWSPDGVQHKNDPNLVFLGAFRDIETGEIYHEIGEITINRPRTIEALWGFPVELPVICCCFT